MKLGFIDYYLDEWHANNYPNWIQSLSEGSMHVAYAYGMIDSPLSGKSSETWCREMGIRHMESIEELVALSDGIIVLSPDNCEMHEALSKVALQSGKPCYIDKTFAPDYESARRIFDLAEKHQSPCFSSSALRFAEEFKGIKDVRAIASWGPNAFENYSIHQLEPIMMLMRSTPEKVLACKGEDWYQLTILFAGGGCASVASYEKGSPFMMNITAREKSRIVKVESDFFQNFILHLIAFFKDPKNIVPHAETLQIMALREACLSALTNPGHWMDVRIV